MTEEEAFALINSGEKVLIRRSGATWEGRVRGVMNQPAVIVELDGGGGKAAIALDGAEAVPLQEDDR